MRESRDLTSCVTWYRGSDVKDSGDNDARATGVDSLLKHTSLVPKRLDVSSVFKVRVCRRHMHCTTHTVNTKQADMVMVDN